MFAIAITKYAQYAYISNLYDNLSNCDNFGSKNVAIAFYDFMYMY